MHRFEYAAEEDQSTLWRVGSKKRKRGTGQGLDNLLRKGISSLLSVPELPIAPNIGAMSLTPWFLRVTYEPSSIICCARGIFSPDHQALRQVRSFLPLSCLVLGVSWLTLPFLSRRARPGYESCWEGNCSLPHVEGGERT